LAIVSEARTVGKPKFEPLSRQESTTKKMLKEMINIPLISGVVSILLTVIPYLNTFVTKKDWIFYKTFVDSFNAIGSTSSTFVIFLLGLNIAFNLLEPIPDEETVSKGKSFPWYWWESF